MQGVRRCFAAGVLATLAFVSTAGAVPRNDNVLVLDSRAGSYRYLDSFQQGKPKAYAAALKAFGAPSRLRTSGNVCLVTWADAGVTIRFASDRQPCARAHLPGSLWYGMSLHGRRWHNPKGVRVGDRVARVRRLYPKARFDPQLHRPWLVLMRRQVGRFNFVRLAVGVKKGRVTSLEVPATYIY